jgi:hypothetical protein
VQPNQGSLVSSSFQNTSRWYCYMRHVQFKRHQSRNWRIWVSTHRLLAQGISGVVALEQRDVLLALGCPRRRVGVVAPHQVTIHLHVAQVRCNTRVPAEYMAEPRCLPLPVLVHAPRYALRSPNEGPYLKAVLVYFKAVLDHFVEPIVPIAEQRQVHEVTFRLLFPNTWRARNLLGHFPIHDIIIRGY